METERETPGLAEEKPRFSKYFTIDQANRSLVLVERVITDIVARYRELISLRDEVAALTRTTASNDRLQAIQRRTDELANDLNSLYEELLNIGCELKDWQSGLVDFPARHEGRDVWLCWKLGEPAITHWHELDTGFTGRQPIPPDFGRPDPHAEGDAPN